MSSPPRRDDDEPPRPTVYPCAGGYSWVPAQLPVYVPFEVLDLTVREWLGVSKADVAVNADVSPS